MNIINNSKRKYRDTKAIITEDELAEMRQLIETLQPESLHYRGRVTVPNSYSFKKMCQQAHYSSSTNLIEVFDAAAQNRSHGDNSGPKWRIGVPEARIDELKALGWRLIDRASGYLVK